MLDGEKYPGRVENACLMGGSGYVQMCGPRTAATNFLTDSEWRSTYPMHRRHKVEMLQAYAGKFEQLSAELGGEGGAGNPAHRLASLWFNRDVALGDDQAAGFVRGVCKEMRVQTTADEQDGGPEHSDYQPGSMKELAMGMPYAFCKHAVGTDTCPVGFAQNAVDFSYEVKSCMKSQPQCLRAREVCLGKCYGAGGGQLAQDFATTFVKQELSVAAIGSDAMAHGRANCTLQNRLISVPLFDESDAFALYSARLRVRGGFTGARQPPCTQLQPQSR